MWMFLSPLIYFICIAIFNVFFSWTNEKVVPFVLFDQFPRALIYIYFLFYFFCSLAFFSFHIHGVNLFISLLFGKCSIRHPYRTISYQNLLYIRNKLNKNRLIERESKVSQPTKKRKKHAGMWCIKSEWLMTNDDMIWCEMGYIYILFEKRNEHIYNIGGKMCKWKDTHLIVYILNRITKQTKKESRRTKKMQSKHTLCYY